MALKCGISSRFSSHCLEFTLVVAWGAFSHLVFKHNSKQTFLSDKVQRSTVLPEKRSFSRNLRHHHMFWHLSFSFVLWSYVLHEGCERLHSVFKVNFRLHPYFRFYILISNSTNSNQVHFTGPFIWFASLFVFPTRCLNQIENKKLQDPNKTWPNQNKNFFRF